MTQVFDLCHNRDMNKTTKENVEFLLSLATMGVSVPTLRASRATWAIAKERKARKAQIAWVEAERVRRYAEIGVTFRHIDD